MTNKEAIEIIKLAIAEVEWNYPMDYAAAFDKAIEALEKPDTMCAYWERGKYDWKGVPQLINDQPVLGKAVHYHCSNCGCVIAHMRRNYCPDCGAKMNLTNQEKENEN